MLYFLKNAIIEALFSVFWDKRINGMETIKIREDNKKIYKLIYLFLGIYSCIVFYLNIMNVQSLPLLYSLFASTSLILVILIVLGIIKRIGLFLY